MTEILLLVLLLPPPPPPELRQPAVSRATAPAVRTAPTVDLMRMCTPSNTWPGASSASVGGAVPERTSCLSVDGTGNRAGPARARRPRGGSGLGDRGAVTGDAAPGLRGEDVRLLRPELDVHDLTLHRRPLGIDPQGEQLVPGLAAGGVQRAVGVGVGAELLDDHDLEREALPLADQFHRLPPEADGGGPAAVGGQGRHRLPRQREGAPAERCAVLVEVDLDEIHRRRADEAGDEDVARVVVEVAGGVDL